MDLVDKAILFATEKFSGQERKCNGQPAVLHSLEAGAIVSSMTSDRTVIAAAILHDVIEDADVTAEALEEAFGSRVTELVLSETEDKRAELPADETWQIRKEEAIAFLEKTNDIDAKKLYLGDKLSNIRALYNDICRDGDSVWQIFCQKDPEAHHWYYRTIADMIIELRHYPAWQEYDRLIGLIFNENTGGK